MTASPTILQWSRILLNDGTDSLSRPPVARRLRQFIAVVFVLRTAGDLKAHRVDSTPDGVLNILQVPPIVNSLWLLLQYLAAARMHSNLERVPDVSYL